MAITHDNGKFAKRIAKIVLKSLLDCFIGLMIIVGLFFVAFPKFSLKINETLGLKKIQEYNYQMIYKKSNNIADLYNLIIFEGKLENTSKELGYLNEILIRDDFQDFCYSMDSATIKRLDDKKLISYSANVRGYLVARKVYCLYVLGSKNVQSFVYEQTKNGKFKEYSFAAYVDLVVNDASLTNQEKETILSEFLSLQKLDTENNLVSFEKLVKNKVSGLNSLISVTVNENDKLVLKYVLMRLYGANASVYEILGETEKAENNLSLYNELKSELA